MAISSKLSRFLKNVAFRNKSVAVEAEDKLNLVDTNAADILELQTQFNLLLAKLDLDAGVTDEDYESTLEIE